MTAQTNSVQTNSGISMPRLLSHLEGAALLIGAVALYGARGFGWGSFFLFLLAPDLAFLLFLIQPRLGILAYNLVHTYIFPLAIGLFSLAGGSEIGLQVALIWLAHIGMDRLAGYGFRYSAGKHATHFARI